MRKVIAVLGCDYHLDQTNIQLVWNVWQQHCDLCEKYSARMLLGGDIFTSRSGQPLSVLTAFKNMVWNLEERCILAQVIPGNHDKTDANSQQSYLDVYNSLNIKLHSNSGVWMQGEVLFGFIPYFGNDEWIEQYECLEVNVNELLLNGEIDKDMPRILITHMGVEGVRNNDGTTVSSPIKPSMFKNWDKVLVGHYHDASQIGDNIFYTGSVYQNNYGENITDKGFTLIYNDGSIEFVPSEFPRYIKERVDVDDPQTLRNIIDKYDEVDGDHVRIVLRGKKTDLEKVNKIELAQRGFDVKFETVETTAAVETAEAEDVLEYDKSSLMKDFMMYCKDNNIRGGEFKFGVSLIKNI